MIVQCENCETRFHVADARIPEKGARVRCSRCHHRFHITPSSGTAAAPSPAADVSARPPARGGEPRSGEKPREEDGLDNPEFLFDDESKSSERSAPSRPTPRSPRPMPRAAPAPKLEPEPTEAAAPPEPEPAPAPPAPLEQRVVETAGKTAQEMLDLGAPKLDAKPVEFGFGDDAEDGKSHLLGEEPAPERREAAHARAGKALAGPPPELDAGFGGSLGDGEDEETDAGWDTLTRSEEPANVFEAAASFGLVAAEPEPPVKEAGQSAPLFAEAEEPAGDTGKRRSLAPAAFDPEAASALGRVVRVAAGFVGLALLAGTLRGLELQRESIQAVPLAEQAAGWIAADIETFVARDSSGQRVLVVRGNLFPDGAAPPPEVGVSLLEAGGERVGEPSRAWLERLDDAEIAPDALTLRLASAQADELSGVGPKVTGFTALLRDPPARARRVEVTLAPGRAQTRGTATAGSTGPRDAAPAPAPPAPGPASETQLAAPQSATPAPTAPDAVVPAAPAPE